MLASSSKNIVPPERTFRSLLKDLLNDTNTNAILIGERHVLNPVPIALIANQDLLKNSDRKVIIVLEEFHQKLNILFDSWGKKKQIDPTEIPKNFADLSINEFVLLQTCISAGIPIKGVEIESIVSLYENLDPNLTEKEKQEIVFQYTQGDERITKPNKQFSDFINALVSENSLVIFCGGAEHPIATFKEGGTMLDSGMKNKIPSATTLCLLDDSETPIYQSNFTYYSKDDGLEGTYDHYVSTDKVDLYRQAFLDCADEQKTALLNLFLNQAIGGFLLMNATIPTDKGETLKMYVKKILDGYNLSTGQKLSFSHVHNVIEKIIAEQLAQKKENKILQLNPMQNVAHFFHAKLPSALKISQPTNDERFKHAIKNDTAHEITASTAKKSR